MRLAIIVATLIVFLCPPMFNLPPPSAVADAALTPHQLLCQTEGMLIHAIATDRQRNVSLKTELKLLRKLSPKLFKSQVSRAVLPAMTQTFVRIAQSIYAHPPTDPDILRGLVERACVGTDKDESYGLKIDKTTLLIREGANGQTYANEEAYEERIALANAWQSFRDKVSGASYSLLPDLTLDKIAEATKILGL